MSISRFNAVEKASNRKAVEAVTPEHKVSEYYGENVFNRKAMQKYLSKETYKALTHAIDNGTPIDREIANHVAAGMRMWALEKGVTHYTHWFQPLTDITAENAELGKMPERKAEAIRTPRFFDLGVKLAYDFKLYKTVDLQLNGGVQNIFESYQKDFDRGANRDSNYIYGPSLPRSFFAGVKISY